MIYLIVTECKRFCKIGTAGDPEKRLRALQSASPFALQILALREGAFGIEKAIHRAAAAYRIRGEWFTYSEALHLIFDETVMPAPAPPKVAVKREAPPVVVPPPMPEMAGIEEYLAHPLTMSQTELARAIGVTSGRISQLKISKVAWSPNLALDAEKATNKGLDAALLSPVVAAARKPIPQEWLAKARAA